MAVRSLSARLIRRIASAAEDRRGENALRHRSRPQPGEFPAADAAHLPGARGRVFPDHTAIIHGAAAAQLCRVLCARAPARLGAGQARHRARRHRLGRARQHAGDARMPLRRADDRRGAQHHQHPARRRDHRLPARPCRDQGADHRPRILQGDEGGARARQGEAAGDRLRRSGIHRRGRAARRDRVRGFRRGGRSGLRLEDARRRMGRDLAQLHVRHHRRSQGRGLSPSRRLSAGDRQRADRRHGQAPRLSLDAADVPLQRLVLSVDDLGGGRHACVPAPGARAGDVRRDRRPQGDASVRRADRDGDPAQRARRRRRSRCRTWSSSSPPRRRRPRPCWRR